MSSLLTFVAVIGVFTLTQIIARAFLWSILPEYYKSTSARTFGISGEDIDWRNLFLALTVGFFAASLVVALYHWPLLSALFAGIAYASFRIKEAAMLNF